MFQWDPKTGELIKGFEKWETEMSRQADLKKKNEPAELNEDQKKVKSMREKIGWNPNSGPVAVSETFKSDWGYQDQKTAIEMSKPMGFIAQANPAIDAYGKVEVFDKTEDV